MHVKGLPTARGRGARVWSSDPSRFTVVAGWALDDDGERWRPHVWAWDVEAKTIVESSGATRLIYLGAALAETEASEITAESPVWLSIA